MSPDLTALRRRLQQALGEEFTVGALLGEGGFAAVFRVRDKALSRDLAVKVLDLGLTPFSSLAERFVREARTIARLEHPHIVPIHKVGGYRNEILYIAMRCVDGPSLRQLLERYQRLSVGDAARIARQVADALAYAHGQGVVHRDIKPDNILLDASGHVLVTDFGIAKAAYDATPAQLTTEGMVVGTPQYMSPEQATGERADDRSDIYGLGIVLYQMLTGAPPFDGESAQQILMKQATVEPVPIRQVRNDVPEALAVVLHRMLEKDPAQRYQTAEDASQAIVHALPSAARERVKVRPPVGLGAAGCLGLAAFGAGVAVAGYALLSDHPRISARTPIPDSVASFARRVAPVPREDSLLYVFAPHGERQRMLVVTNRHIVALTSAGSRTYPRDGLTLRYALKFSVRKPLYGVLLLIPEGGGRDTLFADLSPRELYAVARAVAAGR